MMTSPLTLLLLVSLYHVTQGETIVLMSPPHTANVRTYTNTARALTKLGHHVYMPIPAAMLTKKSIDTRGFNVIKYGDSLPSVETELNAKIINSYWNNVTLGLSEAAWMLGLTARISEAILADKTLIAQLKAINPHMFVINQVPFFRDLVVLPYMLGVPFCMLSPYNDPIGFRVPISLSAIPPQVNGDFHEVGMTFSQRLVNSLMNLAAFGMHEYFSGSSTMVAKYAPNRPLVTTEDIYNTAEVFLVESDYIMDYARPQMPNVKIIGSTASNPAAILEEPFFEFMEKSSLHGVVVMTFGSAIKEFPDYIKAKMVRAFSGLKQRVVWRVNMTSPDPDHLMTSSWLPQNDLLGHKNTKLFVSHCGMNGQYEALYHAVPTLCLPLFGDMPYNAQRGVGKGFGLKADIRDVTSEELLAMMEEMMSNSKYKISIFKASSLYRQLFKSPVNESAFWVDHVIQHGGAYMRSAGQNMPMYQFLALDVLVFLSFVCFVLTVVLYITCLCTWRLFCGKREKTKAE